MAGDQVPVMPLVEVAGRVKLLPVHTGPTCVKAGVMLELTVTVIVVAAAHCPALGVKV